MGKNGKRAWEASAVFLLPQLHSAAELYFHLQTLLTDMTTRSLWSSATRLSSCSTRWRATKSRSASGSISATPRGSTTGRRLKSSAPSTSNSSAAAMERLHLKIRWAIKHYVKNMFSCRALLGPTLFFHLLLVTRFYLAKISHVSQTPFHSIAAGVRPPKLGPSTWKKVIRWVRLIRPLHPTIRCWRGVGWWVVQCKVKLIGTTNYQLSQSLPWTDSMSIWLTDKTWKTILNSLACNFFYGNSELGST